METNSIDQLISFSDVMMRWLLTWSWQILLLLSVVWVVLKFDRSHSATTRYRIWLIALVAVSVMPFLSLLIYILRLPSAISPSLFPSIDTRDYVALTTSEPSEQFTISWLSILGLLLFAAWMIGVIVSLARLGNSLRKLHKIKSQAQTVSVADINCSDPDLLLRSVSITLSKGIQSPGLAGFIRPTILLPADITSWTNPEERTAILRHEFAHLDRRDHLVSLFQSILKALLFFHPMLRYACDQLSLERELACDDRVLDLGTEPDAYAESILKAAERSFLTDVVHQTASFASKRKLERRIEMILDTSRMRQPLRQWKFLLLPVSLISIMTWLVIPAASNQSNFDNTQPEMSGTIGQVQSVQIWTDTVKRGTMLFMVRGLGTLLFADTGQLKAQINIPELQAKDIKVGQTATIDTRKNIVSGKVFRISPRTKDGIVTIDISLEGELPKDATSGLNIDGVIEIGRLDNVLYVGTPVNVRPNSTGSLFKLEADGKTATRVKVRFGKVSINKIEVIDGLKAEDKVILSDMSQFDGLDTVRLN
jgi:beta-lactamase regulating signal transducer with metallopeptidase domain